LTAVPDFKFLISVLNAQVLSRTGHRFVSQEQTLDVFQEDETKRSTAFVNYRRGGIWPSVASKMLGLDLPDGMEAEKLDEMMMEARQMDTDVFPPEALPGKAAVLVDRVDHLHEEAAENERRQYRNYLRKGRDPALFEFNVLDEFEQFQLLKELPSPTPSPAVAGPDPESLATAIREQLDLDKSALIESVTEVVDALRGISEAE